MLVGALPRLNRLALNIAVSVSGTSKHRRGVISSARFQRVSTCGTLCCEVSTPATKPTNVVEDTAAEESKTPSLGATADDSTATMIAAQFGATEPAHYAQLATAFPPLREDFLRLAVTRFRLGNADLERLLRSIPKRLTHNRAIASDVTRKYGVDPKKYDHLFDKNMPTEDHFSQATKQVTLHLNEVAQKAGKTYRFTESEIAVNVISEGAYYVLVDGSDQEKLSGFSSFGIDTFMQRIVELRPWLNDDLRTWASDEAHHEPRVNEKGEDIVSLRVRDLAMGTAANGAMFAAARERFSKDAERLGVREELTHEAWFFWTSVYYNAGEGTGLKLLKKHGVKYWQSRPTEPDNVLNPKSNAAWRTATWDYLRRALGDNLDRPRK